VAFRVSAERPDRRAAGEDGIRPELLLDTQQLVVLAGAIGPAGRAGLDLAGRSTDCQIRDRGVLVSPDRCEIIVAYPAFLASATASSVSVTVPI
jgi:hypothetical protein